MVVAHNLLAMNSQRQLSLISGTVSKKVQKLSSGYRINKATDDAAGLAISEKMRKQVRGLTQASLNAEDGISMVQTADGALEEVHEMLQRMNELCVRAANGTNSTSDRRNIQDEVSQLITEIDRVSETTRFNETNLLDGSIAKPGRNATTTAINNKKIAAVEKKLADDKTKLTVLNGENAGKEVTAEELANTEGTKIVYVELAHDVETTQSPAGVATVSGYDPLKTALKEQIVPQAVSALLAGFPQAYGYLNGSSIGIGLELYSDAHSSTLASVTLGVSGYLSALNVTYKLSVNMASLNLDGSGNIPEDKRTELENTIIHEMTHAMMDEVLTAGMLGYVGSGTFNDSEKYPLWFVEGMANASAGACYDGNDWVNGTGDASSTNDGLNIQTTTSPTDIQDIIKRNDNKLGSGTTTSLYGTGYLACMYLGYLANGDASDTSALAIRNGLDKILSELKSGKSLNQVISENTVYSNIGAFETGFNNSGAGKAGYKDSATFIKTIVTDIGSGSGGLVPSGNYAGNDKLPNVTVTPAIKLFELNTTTTTVNNNYPGGYEILTGGTATGTGIAGPTGSGTGGTGGGTGGTGGGTGIAANVHATGCGAALHIGGDADMTNKLVVYIDAMDAESLGVSKVDVTTEDQATISIERVSLAIAQVSAQRSALGAYQNRLEHTINNLDNVVENTTAAESQIRDTDMAKEMVAYANGTVIQQACQSMLTQANQSNQGVLSLIA